MTETEESPGVESNMRRTVKSGRRAGWAMIASGIVLAFGMFALDRGYALVPVASLLVSVGATAITGLGFAKAIQANAEAATAQVGLGPANPPAGA